MARGLQFQSSWVWARDIGDLERGQTLENPYDRERERSVAPDIPDSPFHDELDLSIPVGERTPVSEQFAHPALNAIVGGWDISGIFSYYSGSS